MKGGIKTAFPSKTATCFRAGKPILFCIDSDCAVQTLFSSYPNLYFCDCESPQSICDALGAIDKTKDSKKLLMPSFMSCKNAFVYSHYLTCDDKNE